MRPLALFTLTCMVALTSTGWAQQLPASGAAADAAGSAPAPGLPPAVDIRAAAHPLAATPLGQCLRRLPAYPFAALSAGMQGRSVVSFVVLPDGKAQEPSLLRTSGHSFLDHAAVAHVRRCLVQYPGSDENPLPAGHFALPVVWRIE
jgi:TonB family protein